MLGGWLCERTGCLMIRLIFLLCAGLFAAFMIFGADNGQKRYGLMLADQQRATPAAVAAPQPAQKPVVYIPAQAARPIVTPDPAPTETVAVAAPEMSDGLLYTVAASQVNVRSGPGRDFAVLSSLNRGEQVLVVIEEQPVEGWARVRIEGDGIEGYVATRLLNRTP